MLEKLLGVYTYQSTYKCILSCLSASDWSGNAQMLTS